MNSYLHEVTISGLKPATIYKYRINSNGALGEPYTFKTAPPAGSPISFLAISDAQMKPDLPMTVAAIGKQVQPDLIIFSGDLVDEPDRVADWTMVSFHQPILGQGHNTSLPFCNPVKKADGTYEYPRDVLYDDLRPLFEKHRVDLVVWGHSHVYEHYYLNGVHYMEASSIGNSYGLPNKERHDLKAVYQNAEDRSFLLFAPMIQK